MARFYCPNLPHPRLPESSVQLDDAEARHARRVLRLNIGDTVELFDGRGGVASGVIESWQAGATVRITRIEQVPPPRPRIDVAAALPKGGRADEMINQLVQLGADSFTPLRTQRSSVDPRDAKLERLQRIALEAVKQCGRAHLMAIHPQVDLATALEGEHDLRLAGALAEAPPMAERLKMLERIAGAAHVQILIGPEGGWTESEQAQLASRGCTLWRFAPHILRIESAAAAAVAIARYGVA